MEKIQGMVSDIVFKNEENGYKEEFSYYVFKNGFRKDCVDGKSGLNTITASGLSKTLTLSYYAVAASSLVAQ